MYAVIEQGGKQYTVSPGKVIRLEKIEGEVGGNVDFDRVLLVNDGQNLNVGAPAVEGVPVKGEIVAQYKGRKILIVKKKRRTGYRRINGHRQNHTEVRIVSIGSEQ